MKNMIRMLKVRTPLALALLLFTFSSCHAEELIGKIVAVHDGDTVTLLTKEKAQIKIRLEGIDAPELKQAFGNVSKAALSKLCFGKKVRVTYKSKDRYGRTLGDIYDGKIWTNLAMVKNGNAWVYLQYSHDPQLMAAEAQARQAQLGLWRDSNPIPPWEWRREQPAAKKPKVSKLPANGVAVGRSLASYQ